MTPEEIKNSYPELGAKIEARGLRGPLTAGVMENASPEGFRLRGTDGVSRYVNGPVVTVKATEADGSISAAVIRRG